MKKIAICGNIASGKTTVQKFLEEKGFKVLDTDEVSHKLLTNTNKELYEAFKNLDVFDDTGEFSRYKVGQLIFSDENYRKKISEIMHPQIAKEIEKFFETKKNEDLVFVGIPLLFEANMQNLFDKIIFVYTDDEIRLKRLLARNNYTLEHAKARMISQITQEKKIKLSDYIINNNGTLEELHKNLFKLIEQIR